MESNRKTTNGFLVSHAFFKNYSYIDFENGKIVLGKKIREKVIRMDYDSKIVTQLIQNTINLDEEYNINSKYKITLDEISEVIDNLKILGITNEKNTTKTNSVQ